MTRLSVTNAGATLPEFNSLDLRQRAAQGAEDIIVVDTTYLLGIQDGNGSAAVSAALAPWVEMARARGSTVIFAHHTNKSLAGDPKAVAGSCNFAAIVDCVLVLRLDEPPNRRVLGGASRVLAPQQVVYGLADGELKYLGDPSDVALDVVAEKCLTVLCAAPEDKRRTREVLDAMEDPKPSLSQVQQALTVLAQTGGVLRDPPVQDGAQSGKTCRWWVPAAPTSPPTACVHRGPGAPLPRRNRAPRLGGGGCPLRQREPRHGLTRTHWPSAPPARGPSEALRCPRGG